MHTINIVSDVSCPWCIIGYRSLQSALSELGIENSIRINWLPFELNPEMPIEGQNRSEYIQQKYGISEQQAQANRQQLVDRGLELGYEFNFPDNGRVYNTFNAHRLIHWSKSHGLQTELKLALFDLYFKQAGNPSDSNALLACVKSVGLSTAEAQEILESDSLSAEVRADQQRNHQNGISAVPAFIFNNKYLVSGGQPKETFIQVMQELDKEAAATTN